MFVETEGYESSNYRCSFSECPELFFRICWSLVFLLILTTAPIFPASAEVDERLRTRIAEWTSGNDRGPFDARKDQGRRPAQVLSFFGVREGMTVLDMGTGSGYGAEMLSVAVGANGLVYAQNSFLILRLVGGEHHEGMIARLENDRLPNVRYMLVEPMDMPFAQNIDFAQWSLNIHDEYYGNGEQATIGVLRGIFRALRSGGLLGISDHVGVEGFDNGKLHRIEPSLVLSLLEKAGFIIVSSSDLLKNSDDDHSLIIYDDRVRYRTDQFLIKARKP
jgi:predicted methyltransferase